MYLENYFLGLFTGEVDWRNNSSAYSAIALPASSVDVGCPRVEFIGIITKE